MQSKDAYEISVNGDACAVLILCDHASNRVPHSVGGGSLGLPAADMERHIAYDIGAAGVSRALAHELKTRAVLSTFSRLVIDPNRGADDPTLVMRLYDGSIIPTNRNADRAEVARRREAFYRPYHSAISREIDEMQSRHGEAPVLVSIHSFTPQLRARAARPWHLGILSAHDRRLAEPLMATLADDPDIMVGDNVPYRGDLVGDCMDRHGLQKGLLHVLIEVRNDLIETEENQRAWAARLAAALTTTLDKLKVRETTDG